MAGRKKRRSDGEGGLYQRKSDGLWVASLDLGFLNGKRRRKVFSARTQAAALAKLRAAQRAIDRGVPIDDPDRTVAEYLEEWLVSVEPTVRPRTFTRYKGVVQKHLIPSLGRHKLRRLTTHHVETMLRAKARETVPGRGVRSPRTVQEIRTILGNALRAAQASGYVEKNVASLARGPRVPSDEVTPLTDIQARQLMASLKGHYLEPLFITVLTTGLRQGELLGLTWDDVDFDAGEIHVRHALDRVDRRYVLVELKTARSRRTIPLSTVTVSALREHRRRQNIARLQSKRWNDLNLVFTTERGKPIYGQGLTLKYQEMLAALGLPKQRFHDLRHAAATFMLSEGIELKVVSEVLGHSTISITADIYAHVVSSLKRDAADRLDAIFAG